MDEPSKCLNMNAPRMVYTRTRKPSPTCEKTNAKNLKQKRNFLLTFPLLAGLAGVVTEVAVVAVVQSWNSFPSGWYGRVSLHDMTDTRRVSSASHCFTFEFHMAIRGLALVSGSDMSGTRVRISHDWARKSIDSGSPSLHDWWWGSWRRHSLKGHHRRQARPFRSQLIWSTLIRESVSTNTSSRGSGDGALHSAAYYIAINIAE